MFKTLVRIAEALEGILAEIREMRQEQRKYIEAAGRDAFSPAKILELMDGIKKITAGGR